MHSDEQDRLDTFTEFYQHCASALQNDTDIRHDYPRLENTGIDTFDYYTVTKFNNLIKHNKRNLSVLNMNVRGIACNYDNLTMYLNTITHTFDVIVLNECHIKQDAANTNLHSKFPLTGYELFYVKSTISYGGVMIYVLDSHEASYFSTLTRSNNIMDSCFIKIHNSKVNDEIYIGGYYRFCYPGKDEIQAFISHIEDDLGSNLISKHNTIICGDFNICLMKSTVNVESSDFLNTLIQNGFECHIFKPTRIQHHKNSLQIKSMTLIDQISSNISHLNCKSGNIDYPHSDHYGNFAIFENIFIHANDQENKDIYRRNLKKIDLELLHEDFYNINWNTEVYLESNMDTACHNLVHNIETLLDKHAPRKKVSKRKLKYLKKPWIDNELLKEIKHKNTLYSLQKQTPTTLNINNYRNQRNLITKRLRNKKKRYFADYFKKHKADARKMWAGMNLALDSTRKKKSFPNSVTDTSGVTLNNPGKIANSFARFFENIPGKTKKKIPKCKKHYLHYLHKQPCTDNYLTLHNANTVEIYKHILKIKDSSSPGPIDVPNVFLKLLALPLAPVLMHIINYSMTTGYVPFCFKVGKQTPVFKSGEVTISNYRPITVCTSLGKILEKVVRDRVETFLMENKILNSKQFGFRRNHSTNHAMINLFETTLDGLDNNLKVGGIFLDISKAFDTVNHDILLRKLEYYGFRGTTLIWFESYLKNRHQYVSIKNTKSNTYTPMYGVPQGATLAPILFILYMNDILHSSSIFEFSMYADDTCLTLATNTDIYDETLRIELDKVNDWFNCNELLLNIDKTDYLMFGPRYNLKYENNRIIDITDLHTVVPQYLINDSNSIEHRDTKNPSSPCEKEFILKDLHSITPHYFINEHFETKDGTITTENSSAVKYLGVHIDKDLKFVKHIKITNCKIARMINSFWKCPIDDTQIKKQIYHALVESHLNYGILMYASNLHNNVSDFMINSRSTPSNLKQLAVTQNKIIRAILRIPKYDKHNQVYNNTSPLYKKLHILKLEDLYRYNLGILCHNVYYSKTCPTRISELFTLRTDIIDRNTRCSEFDFYFKTTRLTTTQKCPSIAGAKLWNSLPTLMKSIKSLSKFKIELKALLISKY